MINQVREVSIKKQGTGAKGPWTMYQALLDDGRKATGFHIVAVGDYVEAVRDGKYLNYKKTDDRPDPNQATTPVPQTSAPAPRQHVGMTKDDYWERKEDRDRERDARDVAKQPRIERQHAQEMALRYITAKCQLACAKGDLEFQVPEGDKLRDLISWFVRDISHPTSLALPPKISDEPKPEPY